MSWWFQKVLLGTIKYVSVLCTYYAIWLIIRAYQLIKILLKYGQVHYLNCRSCIFFLIKAKCHTYHFNDALWCYKSYSPAVKEKCLFGIVQKLHHHLCFFVLFFFVMKMKCKNEHFFSKQDSDCNFNICQNNHNMMGFFVTYSSALITTLFFLGIFWFFLSAVTTHRKKSDMSCITLD